MRYEKAVRDNVPRIIRGKGEICEVKVLSEKEFLNEMEKKLAEETNEYLESKSIEELVDILEVVYRISELRGTSPSELESYRKKKQLEKGGFSKNLFLIETRDDQADLE